jgi:hypothetical protein
VEPHLQQDFKDHHEQRVNRQQKAPQTRRFSFSIILY